MKQVKNLIIGFGKAGETLAAEFSKQGEDVILVEQSPKCTGELVLMWPVFLLRNLNT